MSIYFTYISENYKLYYIHMTQKDNYSFIYEIKHQNFRICVSFMSFKNKKVLHPFPA
jgi:hypothetical protein